MWCIFKAAGLLFIQQITPALLTLSDSASSCSCKSGILDTKRTGSIPSCEVPHRTGTGHGVISRSKQRFAFFFVLFCSGGFLKNTLQLSSGSR